VAKSVFCAICVKVFLACFTWVNQAGPESSRQSDQMRSSGLRGG
jgi:hypothetical protein